MRRPNTPSRATAAFLALSSLAFAGCGADPGAAADGEIETAREALINDYQDASAIYVLDSGYWQSGYIYHGAYSESFWVDLSIRNDAYDKSVGIVWTSDGWATTHTAMASYKGSLGGNRERWGLDVPNYINVYGNQPEAEYAAFVTMNGQTQWSVFRNHYIHDKVTVDQPLRLLSSGLSVNGSGQPVLSASIRALNVPADRHVFARYTTNGWSTWAEAEASFDGHDFQLSVPLSVTPASETVDFALRLETAGELRWDNNGGSNYTRRLAPSLQTSALQSGGAVPSGGIEVLTASFQSDLPLQGVAVGIDGGAATPVSFSGLGVLYPFLTAPLAAGTHAIRFEVTGAGGFQRTFAGPTFAVKNDLAATASWRVPVPAGENTSFDAQRLPDGSYVALLSHTIARYASIGAGAPAQVYAPAPISYVLHDLAIDGQGRAYAVGMDGSIVRWRADGTVDTSFGSGGVLALTGTVGTSSVCNVASVEATASYLYVVDSCNGRVLRLAQDGSYIGEVGLSTAGSSDILTSTYAAGSSVWVLRSHYDTTTQTVGYAVIELDDTSAGAPAVLRTVPFGASAGNVQSFAVTASGFWATNANDLLRLDTTGAVQGVWLGGGSDYPFNGALELPSRIDVLADGSVAVLAWGSGRVETFAPVP